MKRLITLFLFLTFAFFQRQEVFATHNRAGEITYRHITGKTYEITITTYTRFNPNQSIPSNQADRPELYVNFGLIPVDIDTVQRTSETQIAFEIKKNEYTTTFTYPGPGSYVISVEDPNRNINILNMGGTSSENIPFALQTTLIINPFLDPNSSPQLLYPPIDKACVDQVFWHNPSATDPDGDSLSYTIVTPLGGNLNPVAGYFLPNVTTVNQYGDLKWAVPSQIGEFNFALEIKEWRWHNSKWIHVGTVLRDLQVTVENCNNKNPDILDVNDTCVLAGTLLSRMIYATDPDAGQSVSVTATGGPFLVPNPATFTTIPTGPSPDTAKSLFEWQTACSNVRRFPYQVYFKAKDSGMPVQLLDVETWNITVVGPAPQNPVAVPSANNINLTWTASPCQEVVRYDIYRKLGYYGYFPGHCELGVPAYTGYSLVGSVNGVNNTSFTDNNNGAGLVQGHDYCYMVVAVFPDGAESYASVETCAKLKLDVPVITNVSVLTTGNPGVDSVAWARPRTPDFSDTIFPGPYRYLIYRANNLSGNNMVLIDSTALSPDLFDTNYVDNTVNSTQANSYRIDLYDYSAQNGGRYFIGSTNTASSVFLTLLPSDNSMTLNWTHNVPWTNTSYTIYRKLPWGTTFDSLTTVSGMTYTDTGLVNERSYCYYVKSYGFYSIPGLVDPIINLSQQACEEPVDLIAPCPPGLTVMPDCEAFVNDLSWTNPNTFCADDVVRYNLYFKPTLHEPFALIQTFAGATTQTWSTMNEVSIAGCYYITAVDSFNNESIPSDTICVDNCPVYELPNVFTPDGDGVNDYFIPLPYRFVESIDLTIFNRWGQIVFTTTDRDIRWNGTEMNSGAPLSEGVYYYVCTVNEIRLPGIVPRTIDGFFHLFRSKDDIPTKVN